jgi:hypothetical protein
VSQGKDKKESSDHGSHVGAFYLVSFALETLYLASFRGA